MANATNFVALCGNLTRDAEVRTTQGGDNSVRFGVAWSRRVKQQDGSYADRPEYFDCECWANDNQLRHVQPRLVKGAPVTVFGRLEQQTWKAQDGGSRSKVVVRIADPFAGIVMGAPRQQQAAPQPAPQYAAPAPACAPQPPTPAPQPAPQAYAAPQAAYAAPAAPAMQPLPMGQTAVPAQAPQFVQAAYADEYSEEIPF